MADLSPLIQTAELAALLGASDLKVLDGTWHLDGTDPRPGHAAARIPGAVFFDIDAVSDPDTDLPHMLPSPEAFAQAMGELGVSEADRVVVYDSIGVRSAPRVWWTLRAMGARRVQVLDGGLPRWIAGGRPVESGPPPRPAPSTFQPRPRSELVRSLEQVRSALVDGSAQLLDARPSPRFRGEVPEPRAGLRSGHMPGALNLPFAELLAPDGRLRPAAELEAALVRSGVDLDRPIITTCGSGITAAILALGLALIGREAAVYDGSWAEWGGRADTRVEAG